MAPASRVLSRVLAEKDRMIDVQVDLHKKEAEVAKDSLEILSVEDPAAQADRKVDQWEADR